jgi:hypothetical protein
MDIQCVVRTLASVRLLGLLDEALICHDFPVGLRSDRSFYHQMVAEFGIHGRTVTGGYWWHWIEEVPSQGFALPAGFAHRSARVKT